MEGVSKNGSDYKMCSNLSNHRLKVDCYKHSLVYMNHMVTRNQKCARDIQEIKRKESKDNTIESYQHTKEESKRVGKEL